MADTLNPAGDPTVLLPDFMDEPAGTGNEPNEFQRFADLAGKLVQVPKAELDEQRQKS